MGSVGSVRVRECTEGVCGKVGSVRVREVGKECGKGVCGKCRKCEGEGV